MATQVTHRQQRKRPTGITILAILEFIGAISGILGGIALLALGGASVVGGGNVGGGGYFVSGAVLLILGVVALVLGVVALVLGYGYWTLQPWAWPLGIGLQILGLVVDVISIVRGAFVGSQCLSIIISVIVLFYLTGPEVRHAFRREPQPLPSYPPSGYPPNAPAPYEGYPPPSGYEQAGGYSAYAPPSSPMAPSYPPPVYPQMPPTPLERGLQWWHGLLIAGGIIAVTCVLCGSLYTLAVFTARRAPAPSYSYTTPVDFPSPTPTAVKTVVYQNTFAANADGWTQDSHCFEGPGGYHIANVSTCYAPIGAQTDIDIFVKAKTLTGNTFQPFGIVFGVGNANISYRFMVYSGNQALESCSATTCSLVLEGGAAQWGMGDDITLEVNVKGKFINTYLNGERGYYNDLAARYTGGKIGLAVSGVAEVVFSDLVIAHIA